MSDMQSFLTDLLADTHEGRRGMVRARLRVDVAEGLLLRMESMNMSKAQLADALGVSRSAVSQALTGTRNMSLNLLADMADALGLQPKVVLEDSAAEQAPAAVAEHGLGIAMADSGNLQTITLQLQAVPNNGFRMVGTSTSAALVAAQAAMVVWQ